MQQVNVGEHWVRSRWDLPVHFLAHPYELINISKLKITCDESKKENQFKGKKEKIYDHSEQLFISPCIIVAIK